MYRLILIDNRDVSTSLLNTDPSFVLYPHSLSEQEVLTRPTAPAAWWDEPDMHILSGRDLLRSEGGTWLAVTKDGRVAVLTNFIDGKSPIGLISRGNMLLSYLREPRSKSTAAFAQQLGTDTTTKDAGGFSLICGKIGEELAVVSNNKSALEDVHWVMGNLGQTVALSNAAFGDKSWPKIRHGEELMATAVEQSHRNRESEGELIEILLDLLSSDDLPRCSDGSCELNPQNIRSTVMVPLVDWKGLGSKTKLAREQQEMPGSTGRVGVFATQKQTIVLADYDGRVRFFERTLFDGQARPIAKGSGDRNLEFHIEKN